MIFVQISIASVILVIIMSVSIDRGLYAQVLDQKMDADYFNRIVTIKDNVVISAIVILLVMASQFLQP